MEPLGALSGAAGGMADAVAGIIEQRLRQAQVANQAQEAQARNQAAQAALAETARHNQAIEGQTQQFQAGELANTAAQRSETANKDFVTNVLQQMPIGTPTSPQTRARASAAGVDPNAFTQTYQPPSLGMSTPTGEVGPSAEVPQGAWRGTQAQIEKIAETTRAAQDREQTQADLRQNRDVLNTLAGNRQDMQNQIAWANNALGYERLQRMKDAADAKASTLNISQGGKAALSSIEQAAPLTDQVLAEIKKQYPDIDTNPEKYNTLASKGSALWQKAWYMAGFGSEDEGRKQIESLLQPIQAGQYMRSSRSRQMLELNLAHMADQGQTVLSQYIRLKTLRGLMPEMREGIIRSEQPVDPNNPLAGSYLGRVPDPTAAPAPAGGPATAGGGEWIDLGGGVKVRKK